MVEEVEKHVAELLPAYALGILSPAEARPVAEHLAQCASCRDELRAYEEVGGELALAVPVVQPPAGLEERLLERVAPRTAPPTTAPAPSWATQLRSVWERIRARPLATATVALGLLLLVFLVWLETPLWEQVGNFPTFALAGTDAAPGASGMVISSEDGLHGTVVVQQLPDLDEGHVYQLWLIRDETWEDGGTFTVDEDGYGARYALADRLLTSYDTFAVTVEPADGSRVPTGIQVLQGEP